MLVVAAGVVFVLLVDFLPERVFLDVVFVLFFFELFFLFKLDDEEEEDDDEEDDDVTVVVVVGGDGEVEELMREPAIADGIFIAI